MLDMYILSGKTNLFPYCEVWRGGHEVSRSPKLNLEDFHFEHLNQYESHANAVSIQRSLFTSS